MKHIANALAKAAAISIFCLTAFHAYGAAVLFYILARGRTTEWEIFNVFNCCDIPKFDVQQRTANIAFLLLAIAYTGRWLVPGLWRFKRAAWCWSLLLCLSVIGAHWMLVVGKTEYFQEVQMRFILLCFVPVGLLVFAAPLYFTRSISQ